MTEIPKNAAPLLEKWNGKKAKLWFYTASFQKLVIRLEEEGVRGNLHVTCSGCMSLKAPTFWGNCHLEVTILEKDDRLGIAFCVQDEAADVLVMCRSIHFDENAEPLF